ncbi:hypothetical protein LOK49_LG06G02629 [Camellia lanceoleosa]|uniref:Uncharacterized protein n=1 Tax=Camellia lanceoleosa TaxID=1840588 RepID=A0ACC0HIX0_9ERIC|nr:hypothetical protein LOK49_LG06G02629 [Camellia lanceoleosa]
MRLSISVKMSNGEILKPEVKLLHTISDVKGIIGSMIGVLVSDNDVVYDGKRLEDGKSLAFYNIIENSIIEILPKLPSLFQIFVKHWNGKTLVLTVLRQHKDKVRDVKDTIFNRLGGPASLVFAGKSLEDDQDLGSYNIQRLSTVHIAVPPPL